MTEEVLPGGMSRVFTESERQAFLAAKHVGVLSVDATDGRPPASVPIWYDYTSDGLIRINTGAGSRKAKLIQKAGAVTLVVQREEPPYQYVVVEGSVVDVVQPAPVDVAEAIAIRYLGDEADVPSSKVWARWRAFCSSCAQTGGSPRTTPATSSP